MITVQLLGGASLRSGDRPLSGPPTQRHRVALLALVVTSWPQPLSRDRAMALLWPERDLAGARRLLNLSVHVLRQALGEGAIVSTADGLLLDPTRLDCDLLDLRAAIDAAEPDRIVRLHAGPLLEGFHLAESTEFGYWLDQNRAELAHAYLGALRTVGDRQGRAGDVHGWLGTCRRLVAADPHSGANVRALMRALDAAGDRPGAIRQADEHTLRLMEDLGLGPDPAVVSLALSLRRAPQNPQTIWSGAFTRRPAVAVLPFLNLDDEPEHEYFADGITEDVIAHLAKRHTLPVISRASVLRFRQRQASLKEIGTALGATRLLDGSVRHAGDRVRIVATLVDVKTDRHLWGETYDRQLTDIFAIQTDVALQIATALEARLSPGEQSRVRQRPTGEVQAWRLFLQGRHWLTRSSGEGCRRAIECFDQAIARDPDFALAWANLATTHTELVEIGLTAPEEGYPRAAEAAANALRLDPELGEAHAARGFLQFVREFDWAGAEHSFQRALELSPASADAWDLYGRLSAALGRYGDAIAMVERAQELDPLAHRIDLATAYLRAGRYDEAVARAEEAVQLDPDHDRSHATLGWACFLSGRQAEGLAALERAVAMSQGNTLWLGQLGQAHGMAGNTEKAREIQRELEARDRAGFVSPYHLAYVHVGLGETDLAMDLVERAVSQRGGPGYGIKGSFLLAPLHRHPRFQALLRQMKLE